MLKNIFAVSAAFLLLCCCGASKKSASANAGGSSNVDDIYASQESAASGDANKAVSAAGSNDGAAGSTFTVVLNANPTTGYSWYWVNKAEAAADSVECKFVAAPSKPMMMGAGGKLEWKFKQKPAGADSLVFHYMRSFEKGASPADTYVYHIKK